MTPPQEPKKPGFGNGTPGIDKICGTVFSSMQLFENTARILFRMFGNAPRDTNMQIRRLTRVKNAFSKNIESHRAAIALHFAHYNWYRIDGSLRVTPAMEAGITDRVWTLTELLG
jgi:hypothetical protein